MSTNNIHDGSLKQLWKVSSGLMISFLSMMAMMFFDRLFLSYYSKDALSAAASSGTLFFAGNLMWIELVATAGVFVSQYNGSGRYCKLGESVWQMIWLSGFSLVFLFLSEALGVTCFLGQVS